MNQVLMNSSSAEARAIRIASVEHTISIGCDKRQLLSDYKDWGKARDFLASQP